jgi:hypothetical protein
MSTRLDAQLQFSSAQAITVDAISENVIDLGPMGGSNTIRDIAAGEGLGVLVHCLTSLTDADGTPTLTVTVESDSTANLATSATVHATVINAQLEAALVTGSTFFVQLPPGSYERYLGLRYTTNSADFDGGTVNAWLIPGRAHHTWRAYSDNSTQSI